jgi:hypothetical protein
MSFVDVEKSVAMEISVSCLHFVIIHSLKLFQDEPTALFGSYWLIFYGDFPSSTMFVASLVFKCYAAPIRNIKWREQFHYGVYCT